MIQKRVLNVGIIGESLLKIEIFANYNFVN
jgi:hypothetical protein